MVWSEYREEANIHDEQAYDSHDGDSEEDIQTLDPEDWQDWHSQDLLNMWFSIRQYVETYGLQNEFLQLASFNDFCSFVHDFSIKSRQV